MPHWVFVVLLWPVHRHPTWGERPRRPDELLLGAAIVGPMPTAPRLAPPRGAAVAAR
jgi:hypothetical protein